VVKFISEIDTIALIGFIAGMLTAISMLPQVIKTIREKKAEDVSLVMLIVLLSGVSLWIYYGVQKNDLPIIISNSISLAINLTMIFLRFRYRDKK
jgi:MtN3 and saliva related transmembrane protein